MGLRRALAGTVLGFALSVAPVYADDAEPSYCQTHASDSVSSYLGGLIRLCGWSVGLSDSPQPAATPAVTPPPPPPPPETKVFVVFFASGDMDLNDPAKQTVSEAVQAAKTGGFAKIHLVGNTDTAEDDAYVLSLARAQAVRDQMQVYGLTTAAFDTVGKAASDLKIPTPPHTKENLNRRVLIVLEK
jgi:Outer membrane protein and related peptidoglycan-associated (lipo)proteins